MSRPEEFLKTICKDKRTLEMFRYLVNNSFLRVVNYHNTNLIDKDRFEDEIKYFSENFVPVSMNDLDTYFETRVWPYDKPGIILGIFEGFRNHYDILLPILNKYKMRSWFYIPSFFLDIPVAQQLDFTKTHELTITCPKMYADGRYALTWDELREIAKDHEICCHTGTHYQITTSTPDDLMEYEIVLAKKRLEDEIGREVKVFCWLYAEEYSFNKKAHKHLAKSGFTYVMSNLKLEKIK